MQIEIFNFAAISIEPLTMFIICVANTIIGAFIYCGHKNHCLVENGQKIERFL